MKKIISLCLLLFCVILVSCKNKEYEELKTKFVNLQEEHELLQKKYDELNSEYENLRIQNENLQKDKKLQNTKYKKLQKEKEQLSENSKLLGKSSREIQEIKNKEMQEQLNSLGLQIEEMSSYWIGKRSDTFLAFNSSIYPCVCIKIRNISKHRIDSISVKASFVGTLNNNIGNATISDDNPLHPGALKIMYIVPSNGIKPNGPNITNMPDIEADINMSVSSYITNNDKEISLGLIKINKLYQQMK